MLRFVNGYILILVLFLSIPTISSAENVHLLAMNANIEGLKHTGEDRNRIINAFHQFYKNTNTHLILHPVDNVTKEKYIHAMNKLIRQVSPNDHVIVYFSGHGTTVPDVSRDEADGFDEALVGYSPNNRVNFNQVIVDDLLAKDLKRLRSRKLTVILDTCHSGGMQKGLRANFGIEKYITNPAIYHSAVSQKNTTSASRHTGTKSMVEHTRGVLYAASAESSPAIEYSKSNQKGGIFTVEFANALQNVNSIEQAFNNARKKVMQRTGNMQVPEKHYYK